MHRSLVNRKNIFSFSTLSHFVSLYFVLPPFKNLILCALVNFIYVITIIYRGCKGYLVFLYFVRYTLATRTYFFYLSMPYRDIWSFTFTGISDGYFLITAFYSPVYVLLLSTCYYYESRIFLNWSVNWLSSSCRFSMKDSWRRRRKTDACIVLQGRQNNIRLSGIDMN